MEIRNQVLQYVGATEPILRSKGIYGRVLDARRGIRHCTLDIQLKDPESLPKLIHKNTMEVIALACRTSSVSIFRENGLVRISYVLPRPLWVACEFSQTQGLGIGFGERKEQIDYELNIPHTLIAGTTGSGKTEISKAIALATIRESIAKKSSLQLAILDPNGKFEPFKKSNCLATPIAERGTEFKQTLKNVHSEFIKRRDSRLLHEPKLMVFIDEADTILESSEVETLRTLTSGGREFGISCVVISQKPTEKTLPGILGNLSQRYVGTVTSPRISSDLTGHKGLMGHKLLGEGDFLKVSPKGIQRFQSAMPHERDFSILNQSLQVPSLSQKEKIEPPQKKIGRPERKVNAKLLARYLVYGPENLTIRYAQETLGISRAAHDWYKAFGRETLDEAKRLKLLISQKGKK